MAKCPHCGLWVNFLARRWQVQSAAEYKFCPHCCRRVVESHSLPHLLMAMLAMFGAGVLLYPWVGVGGTTVLAGLALLFGPIRLSPGPPSRMLHTREVSPA